MPSLAVGNRVALPASAVSKLADSNAVSPAVNDFLESHSLPFAKLQSWLSALPKGYTPSVISLRHGGEGLLFDVVAIRGRMNLPYQVHFIPGSFEEDFERMRSTDRPTLRVGIPQGPDNPESFSEVVVWQNTLLEWDTRIGDGSFIQSKVLEHSRFGSLPVSLSATKAGDSEVWRSSVVKVPGLEHEILLKQTPTEFRMQVEENRAKEWRPHLMQIHGGRPDPMLSAVFIKSSDGQRWEFSPDLSEEQYAAELIKRKAEGFYPAQVVSYVENGQVHFMACWLGMTVTGPK